MVLRKFFIESIFWSICLFKKTIEFFMLKKMAGLFGVVSNESCGDDLFLGTFYTQHRAQDYCGMFFYEGDDIQGNTHKGLLDANFNRKDLRSKNIRQGIGSVSVTREPVSGISRYQSGTLSFDGNFHNNIKVRDSLMGDGATFEGCHFPDQISDCDLVTEMVLREFNFEKGIERLFESIEGDFAMINLTPDGIYAARGFGRKPLVLGKKEDGRGYVVASESTSFINTGYEIVRDVNPGEVVFLDKSGIHNVYQFDLGDNVKFGTFEWIYTAYPSSVIDGRSVSEVRKNIGKLLAEEYPVDADLVSPVPNSGRWHALGYAKESGISYEEAFIRYDYAGRSFTPGNGVRQQEIADTKLIPVSSSVKDKRVVLVDDSIVRGTQTKNQASRVRKNGAIEVHARIACPPLMSACKYGKATNCNNDCVARRMSIEDIRKSRGLDTLEYATVGMLERAIEIPLEKLCLDCWEE